MRQWQHSGVVTLPTLHGLGERWTRLIQMPGLGVLANHQCQLNVPELIQQALPPGFGTARQWRQISGFAFAWIAKAHRQNCNSARIVESCPVHAHPFPEAFTAGIVKGNAGGVHFRARCLSGDQYPRLWVSLEDGSWAQFKLIGAQGTATHRFRQGSKRLFGHCQTTRGGNW